VVADSRAPRDGRYIERIGMYNPNTNPATIDLDFDKAYDWLVKGAQPTDTVRAILSYKGVLYKKHLMGGVKKGAFDEDEAERRLEKWMAEKEAKIQAQKERIEGETNAELKKRLEAEAKLNEERAAAIAANPNTRNNNPMCQFEPSDSIISQIPLTKDSSTKTIMPSFISLGVISPVWMVLLGPIRSLLSVPFMPSP